MPHLFPAGRLYDEGTKRDPDDPRRYLQVHSNRLFGAAIRISAGPHTLCPSRPSRNGNPVRRRGPRSAAPVGDSSLERRCRRSDHRALRRRRRNETRSPLRRCILRRLSGRLPSARSGPRHREDRGDVQQRASARDDVVSAARSLADHVKLKLFHAGSPVSLSDALPMLENMGLRVDDQRPSRVERKAEAPVWIHDFGMTHREGPELDIDQMQGSFRRLSSGSGPGSSATTDSTDWYSAPGFPGRRSSSYARTRSTFGRSASRSA